MNNKNNNINQPEESNVDLYKIIAIRVVSGKENFYIETINASLKFYCEKNQMEISDLIQEISCPMYKSIKYKNDKKVEVDTPLNPGYLFARVSIKNLDKFLSALKIAKVSNVLRDMDGKVKFISDAEFAKMLSFNEDNKQRIVSKVEIGSTVLIESGSFASVSGIVRKIEDDMCFVEIRILNQPTTVSISIANVSIAEDSSEY